MTRFLLNTSIGTRRGEVTNNPKELKSQILTNPRNSNRKAILVNTKQEVKMRRIELETLSKNKNELLMMLIDLLNAPRGPG